MPITIFKVKNNLMKKTISTFAKIKIWVLLFSISFVNAQNVDINLLRDINNGRNKNLDPTFKFITNSAAPVSIGAPIFLYTVGLIKKDSTIKKQAIFIGEAFLVNGLLL